MAHKIHANPDRAQITKLVARGRDILVWRDASGNRFAATRTVAAVKAAMLAMGTGGHFTLYTGSRLSMLIGWREAVTLRRNTVLGY